MNDIKDLYISPKSSHKGQNGRLLIIGGSHLFHSASLWALKVSSRIVDLVHYSSVAENNELVMRLKEEFRDGIIVPRSDIDAYIKEDDVILIGPGMTRDKETEVLTNRLLKAYPEKQWVIDAGALQMMDISLVPHSAILTPHHGEFELLQFKMQKSKVKTIIQNEKLNEQIETLANQLNCVILVKGETDLISNEGEKCIEIKGGNAGMTKGGTGDVLAGLIAALACKNNPFLAARAGSAFNKKAGDSLYKKVGPFFNASDLADEIPRVMKKLLL